MMATNVSATRAEAVRAVDTPRRNFDPNVVEMMFTPTDTHVSTSDRLVRNCQWPAVASCGGNGRPKISNAPQEATARPKKLNAT